jgi:chemotaxis methyl-accepting protein methylase
MNDTRAVSQDDVEQFIDYIRKCRGVELSNYRKTFLGRRLQVRLEATNCKTIAEYIALIESQPAEWDKFIDKLSINVSEFFRDREVFSFFYDKCLSELIADKNKKGERIIRCWSCGCSNGEEPYSLAIMFKELLGGEFSEYMVKVYATDVDEQALGEARKGEYIRRSLDHIGSINVGALSRYFTLASPGVYRVNDELKEIVFFQNHNFLIDKPLINMDVVFFRNVRIYLSRAKAEDMLLELSKSIKRGGYLVLGKVETIGPEAKKIFEPVSLENKIFKKV